MANKLYEESHIQNIANAIRGKTGKSNLLDVSEMANEITSISSGSGLDTSDATVTASDLAEGVISYGKDGKVTGTVKTIKDSEGYVLNDATVASDGDELSLVSYFPKDVLHRENSYAMTRTALSKFGDAVASDVLEGRTFTSADGLKVVGTGTLKMFTWEKYSVIDGTTSAAYSQQEIANKYGTKLSSTTITLYSSMSFNANTGVFTLSGSNINNWGNVYSNKTYQTHPYYFVDDAHTKVAKISSMTPPRTGSIVQNYGVNYTEYYSLANEQGFAKGEYIEDVTSTYSHEYPADGYQDGYWYVLKEISTPKLQDKVITENGTYQADNDYDGLRKVFVEIDNSKTSDLYISQEQPTDTTKIWIKAESGKKIKIINDVNGKLDTDDSYNADIEIEPLDSLAVVNDKIYLVCGYNNGFLSDVRCFDPITGTTSIVGNLGDALNGSMATAIGTKIYVFGGWSGSRNVLSDKIYCYDTTNNTVRTIEATITARENGSAVAVGNKIYVIGGFGGSDSTLPIEIFDIETETVETLTVETYYGKGARATAIGGTIYYVPGIATNGKYARNIYSFNTYDDTPELTLIGTSKSNESYAFGLGSFGNLLYVFGGINDSKARKYNTIDIINTQTKTRDSETIKLPRQLFALGVARVGKTFYAIGGNTGSTPVSYITKFTTPSEFETDTMYIFTSEPSSDSVLANITSDLDVHIGSVYTTDYNGDVSKVDVLKYRESDGKWCVVR